MIHPFRIYYLHLICAQFVQKFSILNARSQQPVSLCVSMGVGVVSLVWLHLPHPHLLLISSSTLHTCHPSSSSTCNLKGRDPSPLLTRPQFKWGQVCVFRDFFLVCFFIFGGFLSRKDIFLLLLSLSTQECFTKYLCPQDTNTSTQARALGYEAMMNYTPDIREAHSARVHRVCFPVAVWKSEEKSENKPWQAGKIKCFLCKKRQQSRIVEITTWNQAVIKSMILWPKISFAHV